MNCPTCGLARKESDRECDCGELLAPWRTIVWSGATLRQRGLYLAAQKDFLGACLAFTQAALANPLDQQSFVDAAKSLAHLGRGDDALRWLEHAVAIWPESNAAEVRDALHAQLQPPATREAAADSQPAAAPAANPTPSKPDHPANQSAARPLLALGPIRPKSGWFNNWLSSDQLDSTWSVVLRMEQQWAGDWRELFTWGRQAAALADQPAVFHYVMGLGCWQSNDRAGAAACFERCLMHAPPVLNPDAYFCCLHLDQPAAAQKVWRLLCDRHGDAAMHSLVEPLSRRLEQWQAREMLDAFRSLADSES